MPKDTLTPTRFDANSAIYYTAICVLFIWAVFLRLIGFDKGIWLDEFSSIQTSVLAPDVWDSLRSYDHPPVYYAFLKCWSYFGQGEEFLRMPSLLFGLGTIFVLGRWLYAHSRVASICGVMLCALLPAMIRYSQEIRGYSLLLLATAMSFYFAERFSRSGLESDLLKLAGSLCLAVGSHLVGIMVVVTIAVYLFCLDYSSKKQVRWKIPLSATAVPLLVSLILYEGFMRGIAKTDWWMPPLTMGLVKETFSYLCGVDTILVLKSSVAMPHLAFKLLLLGLAVVPLAIGVAGGKIGKNWPLLAAVATYCALITIYSVFVTSIFWYRTLLPILIPLIAFVSLQIGEIRTKRLQLTSLACLGLLSLISAFGWVVTEGKKPREEWKQAALYLKQQYQKGDLLVYCPAYAKGPVNYYSNEIPQSDQLSVDLALGYRQNADILSEKLQANKQNFDSPHTLFLLIRKDKTWQRSQQTCQLLEKFLAERSETAPIYLEMGNLTIIRHQIR